MKLIKKERIGSKVKKTYDQAKTPFRRVLSSPLVSQTNKDKLIQEYANLNPAELKRRIDKLQEKLDEIARSKKGAQKNGLEYIFT